MGRRPIRGLGYGRYHYLDSLRFYYIARGSLTETINHVITAHDLEHISAQRYQELYDLGRQAGRALNGYIAYIWKQQQGHAHYPPASLPTRLAWSNLHCPA